MAQKNQIGENGGERKRNPSANPGVYCRICLSIEKTLITVQNVHADLSIFWGAYP